MDFLILKNKQRDVLIFISSYEAMMINK